MRSEPFRNCIRSFYFYSAFTIGTYYVVVHMIGHLEFGRIEDFPWLLGLLATLYKRRIPQNNSQVNYATEYFELD